MLSCHVMVANPASRPFTLSFEGAPTSKSVPVSDLCVLCVSVFSSPNLSRFNFELSTFNCFFPKSRRIRTSAKGAHNPCRMNTSKRKRLKPFRMNTYEKTPGGPPTASWCRLASSPDLQCIPRSDEIGA
jgi:hypothetical protein